MTRFAGLCFLNPRGTLPPDPLGLPRPARSSPPLPSNTLPDGVSRSRLWTFPSVVLPVACVAGSVHPPCVSVVGDERFFTCLRGVTGRVCPSLGMANPLVEMVFGQDHYFPAVAACVQDLAISGDRVIPGHSFGTPSHPVVTRPGSSCPSCTRDSSDTV